MLDQLVESRSNRKENRGGYLLTTFVLIVGLCFSAVLWSLFAKDLGTGNEVSDVSTLVAPLSENIPPAPIQKQEQREQSDKPKSDVPIRRANIMRVDESQDIPDKISVTPNTQNARPNGSFLISDKPEGGDFQGSSSAGFKSSGQGVGLDIQNTSPTPIENTNKAEPPPIIKKAPVETKQKSILTSTGVINGKAKFLPKPVYTLAAKAVRAGGEVNVQVTIDEAGTVISAKAVSGHPLLRVEAEKAARDAKFNPTLLSNQPVKVSGIIVYKFSMQ